MIPFESLYKNIDIGQTEFQNKYFVINKNGITNYGRLKQSLRELQKRREAIINTAFEIQDVKIEMGETVEDVNISEKRKKHILRRLRYKLKNLYKTLNVAKREFMQFYNIAVEERSKISDSEIQKYELEYWKQKILHMAILDYKSIGGISRTTIEAALALPTDLQMQLFNELEYKLKTQKHLPKQV